MRKSTYELARETRLAAQEDAQNKADVARQRRDRAMSMGTLIAAVDAAIGRDADDDEHYYAASTFAVVWAAIGYVIWVLLVLMVRIAVAVITFIARRFRRS